MVKELYVEEPKKEISWEQEVEFLLDFTQSGVPLPDEYAQALKDRLQEELGICHWLDYERDPAAVKADKEWDAYSLAMPVGETPRERLNDYFNDCGCSETHTCEAHRA